MSTYTKGTILTDSKGTSFYKVIGIQGDLTLLSRRFPSAEQAKEAVRYERHVNVFGLESLKPVKTKSEPAKNTEPTKTVQTKEVKGPRDLGKLKKPELVAIATELKIEVVEADTKETLVEKIKVAEDEAAKQ